MMNVGEIKMIDYMKKRYDYLENVAKERPLTEVENAEVKSIIKSFHILWDPLKGEVKEMFNKIFNSDLRLQ